MKLKNEIEVLHEHVEIKNQEIEKLRDTREELIRLNMVRFCLRCLDFVKADD
jgi:cell division protein FtsB